MSRIYVDEILPKDASKISMPDAQLPAGSIVNCQQFMENTVYTISDPDTENGLSYFSTQLSNNADNDLIIISQYQVREISGQALRVTTDIEVNGNRIVFGDNAGRVYWSGGATTTNILTFPFQYKIPASELSGNDLITFIIRDGTGTATTMEIRGLNAVIMEIAQ